MSEFTATEQLKIYIDRYFTQHPKRSRHTLAQKVQVSYSTLTRILTLQTEISFEQAVAILSEVATHSETERFIRQYFPSTVEVLESSDLKSSPANLLLEAANQSLSFELLCFALHDDGLNPEFVREQYGTNGLALCEELLSARIFEFNSELNTYYLRDLPANNLELTKTLLVKNTENFLDFEKNSVNYQCTWYSSRISRKASGMTIKILNEAGKKIIEILSDPANTGNLPFNFATVAKPTILFPGNPTDY